MGGGTRLNRRLVIGAAAALALPFARAAQIDTSPAQPKPFDALDPAGRKVAVPTPGKATIVNFWATWCPPCRAEMPMLQSLPDFYPDRLSLQLVNFKERLATVQRYMKESNSSHPVLLDPMGEGAALWGVRNFPTTVGFDAKGRARWRVRGEYDWSSIEAAKLVEGLWT
jgi:thiol-disulfide isomerase/thioredoxin